jgi:regulator of sigma E protease
METVFVIINYLFWFITVITAVVFVHEFGHYIIARLSGVKIEVFSIGFGKELFGWTDKNKTRWKISVLPLGGYVKMFGDSDPSSNPDYKKLDNMSFKEKRHAFHFKPLSHKAAIVSAGPIFNYILAILIMSVMFSIYGMPSTTPTVGKVSEESPAYDAGLREGDIILKVDDTVIETFEDLRQIIALNTEKKMIVEIMRNEKRSEIELTPHIKKTKDIYGNDIEIPVIGVSSLRSSIKPLTILGAVTHSIKEAYRLSVVTLQAIGQIITGDRSITQIGGPVKIAQYSGQTAKYGGVRAILWFIALISINLGLFNLLPIPILDGGHLLYYLIEAVTGRPMAKKFQDYGLRLGFSFLVCLMIFATLNDIKNTVASFG